MTEQRPAQKGLPRFRYDREEQEVEAARCSVRRWWWEYLRLSKDYWLVSQTNGNTKDRRLWEIWRRFGDVHRVGFDEWWLRRGAKIFREQIDPPRVKIVSAAQPNFHDDGTRVLLDIPLVLRKETALKQARRLLATVDFERPRNVLETSTSQFPINPVAYRLNVLEKMHEVWCAHRELIVKPKRNLTSQQQRTQKLADLFELGKQLRLSEANAKRTDEYDEWVRRQNRMRATVSRYLRRANQLIANVEHGYFPVFKAAPILEGPRFSDRQIESHETLEEQWWAMDLRAKEDCEY